MTKNNKALLVGLIVLAAVVIAAFGWVKGIYNEMVSLDEGVKTAWSQVENQYQRRLDLIPNLVGAVRGFAEHESQTLENVIAARASATSVNLDADQLNADAFGQFQAAQSELSGALSRLLVVVEQYPELKANQNFLELQSQLEGTENRIAVERMRFNETARTHNTFIRSFPAVMLAGMFGFEQKPYFSSETGAESAPVVDFQAEQ